jgi:hypothetical protein
MLYKLTKERDNCGHEGGHGIYAHSENSRMGSYGSGSNGGSAWRERRERMAGLERLDGEESKEEGDGVLNGNVLMVDQLWLWVTNTHTVLSFFPKREGDPFEGPLYQQADLRDSIFNEVNVDFTRQCDNALDLAALYTPLVYFSIVLLILISRFSASLKKPYPSSPRNSPTRSRLFVSKGSEINHGHMSQERQKNALYVPDTERKVVAQRERIGITPLLSSNYAIWKMSSSC